MLINIIGIDGVGKTTQIKRLLDWLKDEKIKSRAITKRDVWDKKRFPECMFERESEEVAQLHFPSLPKQSRSLFYIWTLALPLCKYPPEKDTVVFVDGYWYKGLILESLLGIDEEWFRKVCDFLPVPDKTFVLDLEPEKVLARGHKPHPYECGLDMSCSPTSFIKHQQKARAKLLQISEKEGWTVIDCNYSEDHILNRIKSEMINSLDIRKYKER